MHKNRKNRSGQTMVEYIIIVVLIAITLLVLFGKLSKATAKKVAGATSALDETVGGEAASEADIEPSDRIKTLQSDGTFQ